MKDFKIPSKCIRTNKKRKTLTVALKHYYDNLPEGLDKQTVDDVHEWDDIYVASTLNAGAKMAGKMKKGQATLTVELPAGKLSAKFNKAEEPLVVLQNDYGPETKVGEVLAKLANQKV